MRCRQVLRNPDGYENWANYYGLVKKENWKSEAIAATGAALVLRWLGAVWDAERKSSDIACKKAPDANSTALMVRFRVRLRPANRAVELASEGFCGNI